jgi:hypothetical protein
LASAWGPNPVGLRNHNYSVLLLSARSKFLTDITQLWSVVCICVSETIVFLLKTQNVCGSYTQEKPLKSDVSHMQVYNVGHNYLLYLAFMLIFKEYIEHKRDKIKTKYFKW